MMMRKIILAFALSIIILFFGVKTLCAQTISISFFPASVIQGEPLLVQIEGTSKIASIKKLIFDGKEIGVFMYQNKPSALAGIDLNKKPGTYELKAVLTDGNILKTTVTVGERKRVEVPLGIPEKLGGNTKASEDKMVATLIAENKILANIHTGSKALWSDKFILPLKQIFVTDPYGYGRQTGAYSIPHKGVDYRAKIGTEVTAINRGIVRVAATYRNHGTTIVVDHGLGLMSFYLHLSKIRVKVGDTVERGQIIALSGDSGYTLGAHLHLSVRINDISIDPVKFFALFQ